MELLYLSRADVESIGMTMREILDAVNKGFRFKGLGMTEMPPKPGVHPRQDAFLHAMPAYVKEIEAAGIKWVSGYPQNQAKGLPYISGLLVLNDPDTGIPIAVMDCSWITAMRTGASAGISARYLARKESSVVGILGCGAQARTALWALSEELPDLAEARLYDVFPEAVESYVADMKPRCSGIEFTVCAGPEDMMSGADVVVTAIPIADEPNPPLDAGMLKAGGLAVSLDYDAAWTSAAMRECDKFCSDDIGQLLWTRDNSPCFKGIPESIYADLGELAAGLKPGRENTSERIFSMNMGIAVDDMVTAKALYTRAMDMGIGVKLPL